MVLFAARHHQLTVPLHSDLLPLSRHRGHGRACCRLDPVANDPNRKWSVHRSDPRIIHRLLVEISGLTQHQYQLVGVSGQYRSEHREREI
jgi:hypothetical protein